MDDELVEGYDFRADWFSRDSKAWDLWIGQLRPKRILEIGSFEGRSACYVIEKCSQWHDLEVHCVDTWGGGVEHVSRGVAMSEVEARFDKNLDLAMTNAPNKVQLHKTKNLSHLALGVLLGEKKYGYFDLIYIDGSHQASDVLTDAVMSFQLLRPGGIMVFDDYLWHTEKAGQQDLLNMPKPAVDAFTSIFQRKIRILELPIRQVYVVKQSN